MKINGLYLLDTPRNIGEFELVDHHGEPFNRARLEGKWSLVFFGFTYCPDICPTTMTFLNEFMASLEGTEAEDTQVVMVSVDPARDTVQQLAGYVPFFNPDFIGVTGEFLDIHRFATALNTPFRKVVGEGDNYQVDHSCQYSTYKSARRLPRIFQAAPGSGEDEDHLPFCQGTLGAIDF